MHSPPRRGMIEICKRRLLGRWSGQCVGFNDAQSLFQLHARKVGGARTQCATCGSANSTIRQLRASEQRQHHRRARRIGEGTKRRGCGDGERGAAAWKKRRIALVGGRAMHTCERALRPVKRGNGVVLGQVMGDGVLLECMGCWARSADRSDPK